MVMCKPPMDTIAEVYPHFHKLLDLPIKEACSKASSHLRVSGAAVVAKVSFLATIYCRWFPTNGQFHYSISVSLQRHLRSSFN